MKAAGLCVALACAASSLPAQNAHQQQSPNENPIPVPKTHDDLQPGVLKPLPAGMSLEDIVSGDSIYHGKGHCFACHGMEGEGMPAAGDALTVGLTYVQADWHAIDSLIDNGIPEPLTRSPMQMPPRGGKSDLTEEETERVAAYIWAISQARGEPWPGGHPAHGNGSGAGATVTPTSVRTRADTLQRPRRP